MKNLNSFRFLKMALDHEIERQVDLIETGGRVTQETRLFNVETGETVSMRSKENAHDYRYFPEPDLAPLRVSEAWMARIQGAMPELPAARRQRFIEHHGLTEYNAGVLTATRAAGDYFEKVVTVSGDARAAANWVMGDLAALLKEHGKEITESPVSAENLAGLIQLIAQGKISGKIAKEILPKMFASSDTAEAIAEREGLQPDQRHRRARKDRRRGHRLPIPKLQVRAISRRQADRDRIPGRASNEGQPRTGGSRGGQHFAESQSWDDYPPKCRRSISNMGRPKLSCSAARQCGD